MYNVILQWVISIIVGAIIMGFILFGIKNAFRGKIRFTLTLIFLIVGIACLSFSIGSYYFAEDLLQTSAMDNGGTDFNIYFDDSKPDFYNNTFSIEELNRIRSIPGVEEAIGYSDFVFSQTNENRTYNLVLYGFTGTNLSNNCRVPGIGHIKLIKGKLPTPGTHEILISKSMSMATDLKLGDNFTPTSINKDLTTEYTLDPNKSKLQVVGIINDLQGPGGIINLNTGNELLYNSTAFNNFKFMAVKADHDQINQTKQVLDGTVLSQINNHPLILDESNNQNLSNMYTSFLYMLLFFMSVGLLIMLVTMLKSISDRTREIGVLKAIGWSNKRVMSMILLESITQTVVAWIIAVMILLVFIGIESDIGLLSFFKANINTLFYFLLTTLGMSLLIPIIGSIIPLIYVTHLKPTEALRYE